MLKHGNAKKTQKAAYYIQLTNSEKNAAYLSYSEKDSNIFFSCGENAEYRS